MRRKTEPPIRRRFVARKNGKPVRGTADIDTGANATNLSRTIACELEPHLPPPDTLGVTSSGDVGGNVIEVLIRVGKRSARVRAFIPAVIYLRDDKTESIEGHNLIGLDFLRATKAVIDFRRPRGQELLQGLPDPGRVLYFRPMTKREARLASHIRCRKGK